jgi:hypothetical protein
MVTMPQIEQSRIDDKRMSGVLRIDVDNAVDRSATRHLGGTRRGIAQLASLFHS